jgi:hypothetical protein
MLAAAAPAAQASHFQVDALGFELQRQAEQLLGQLRTQFMDAPQWSQLTANAYETYRRAGNIREVARLGGSMRLANRDVQKLFELNAETAVLIDETQASAAQGQFGSGRDVASAIGLVRLLLSNMEGTVSRLQAAVNAILLPAPPTIYVPGPAVVSRPVVITPPPIRPSHIHVGPRVPVHRRPFALRIRP